MLDPRRPGAGAWKIALASALLGALGGAGATWALHGPLTEAWLLDHPETLRDALDGVQAHQVAEVVAANRAALETPFHGAWAGAEDGDVVLVEFFDYACGFCRASNPDVERLLREDPRLKVVWREFPVLGPNSEQAAVASLAAARAGRFRAFYERLFAAGRPRSETIAAARQSLGLAESQLTDEFRTELQRNFELARSIGATGTPTFVIGDQVLQGAVGYRALRDAVAEARARR